MLMDSEYRASRDIDTIAYIADVRTQRTLSFLAPLRSGLAEGESKGGMTSILTVPKRHSPFGGLSWFFFGRAKKNFHFAKWFLVNIKKAAVQQQKIIRNKKQDAEASCFLLLCVMKFSRAEWQT
ncbi:hypothetical protein [Candidatus Soleaferrea massiliensis]|uniref:hypothetical protein n=1 Tax=Candidatus Soleaferrea massiliensis TaxID=1470354 RepID=UPI00058C46D9|nr:hypothetical protein [Candidatus Soleaferrea massiliensis]